MDRYERRELVGEGTFGRVYLAIDKHTGKEYAMKVIDILQSAIKCCLDEVTLMTSISKLSHPNLIKYETSFVNEDDAEYIILMEYCSCTSLSLLLGGNMRSVIEEYKKAGESIPEEKIIRFIQGILSGTEHLHKNKIVHRNLKPENILFDSKGNIKITDYCISNELENTLKYANTSIGAHTYASVEQLMGISCDSSTDIWSIGCIIHELCCLEVKC